MALSLFLTGVCAGATASVPACADGVKKRPANLAFHVDVLQDSGADDAATQANAPATPTTLEFIGLPLTFGEREASFDRGPGVEAGLYADYETRISDKLRFTARAALAKTKYLDDGWGTDSGRASMAWRYGDDDMALTFEPSWRVTVVEAAIAARDYGGALRLDSRVADGLSFTGGVRYSYHDDAVDSDDRSTAGASSGLAYRFGARGSVNFTFDASYTLSQESGRNAGDIGDLAAAASALGPVIAMSFPLSDELDFAASLSYCRSTDELPRFADEARDSEDRQHLDMRLAWHNRDPQLRPFDLTAGYAFDRLDTTEAAADATDHKLTVALAVSF